MVFILLNVFSPTIRACGTCTCCLPASSWNPKIRHQMSKLRKLELFSCEGFMTLITRRIISVFMFPTHSTGWHWQTWVWHPWLGSQIGPGMSEHELCCLVENAETPSRRGTLTQPALTGMLQGRMWVSETKMAPKKLAFSPISYIWLLTLILFPFK